MVALGTGATPFIGVADAVAVARVSRLRARIRINTFNAGDGEALMRVNPDEIGMESAESTSEFESNDSTTTSSDRSSSDDSVDDDDHAPQMSFCHRSERHVVVGRVAAVDDAAVLVSSVTDCAKLWQAESDRARIPVEVRLVSRTVCTLLSDSVGRTSDGRMELFDVSLSERLRANIVLELVEAASGRVLLSGVKPASAYEAGRQIDLVVRTLFVDWHLLDVPAGVRLILRTLSRSVAEVLASDVYADERGGARVDLSGAVAALGSLLTLCAHDPVQVRQARTVRTTVGGVSNATTVTTQLPWAEWKAVCGDGDDDVIVDVVIEGETLVTAGVATAVCSKRDGVVSIDIGAPHARAVAGAAVELRLSRNVVARVARPLTSARELIVHDLTPHFKRRLLDTQWSRDLWVADERVGCTIASVRALPDRSASARLRFARQAPQLSVGDNVALHTIGAYGQLVAIGASRLRNGLCTHIDRKAFWRVVNQRVVAAATSTRNGSVHVGFCGARVALAQLYQIIDQARAKHGRRIEVFAEVFG